MHATPPIVVPSSLDSLSCLSDLDVNGAKYHYYSLVKAGERLGIDVRRMPQSHRILLERMLAREDGRIITKEHIGTLAEWMKNGGRSGDEIYVYANRVLLQDLTGGPVLGDFAGMRDVMVKFQVDPRLVNPRVAVDLVIDHSTQSRQSGNAHAMLDNIATSFGENAERYQFFKWADGAFDNLTVLAPDIGICHQKMIEQLCPVIEQAHDDQGRIILSPTYLIGTDSHTTMAGALSVMAYGVGGIEAEATMLGQPLSMVIPEAVGVRLTNALGEGITATDLALTLTKMLRTHGVVDKMVVFYGPGLASLALADRATISNMAPEYGATAGIFPLDQKTIDYLSLTGRSDAQINIVKTYAQAQAMWGDANSPDPVVTSGIELDLASVGPSLAGPSQPDAWVPLKEIPARFEAALNSQITKLSKKIASEYEDATAAERDAALAAFRKNTLGTTAQIQTGPAKGHDLRHGDIAVAAITSCTNTSNPWVMVAAGLVAKKAVELGLKPPSHVKTSLAPGSPAVSEYLKNSGLQVYLDQIGYNVVGHGCFTCIGNGGGLLPGVDDAVQQGKLVVAAVLSGNRNFEARIDNDVKTNWLASPPLVIAYALAGRMDAVIRRRDAYESDGSLNDGAKGKPLGLGVGKDGKTVFIEDVWPSGVEVDAVLKSAVTREVFAASNRNIAGPEQWQKLAAPTGLLYEWDPSSGYYGMPPYFKDMPLEPAPVTDVIAGRILGIFGDGITTDHISPAAAIVKGSPAAIHLDHSNNFNGNYHNYGARRGQPEIINRGTFANVQVQNLIEGVKNTGSATIHFPSGEPMSIYDAAMRYVANGVSSVIFAGRQYGKGSSRDLAAKGPSALGVKVIIAESFERIHRQNLASMGVLPLQLPKGLTRESLALKGTETITVRGMDKVTPRCQMAVLILRADGTTAKIDTLCRIDTDLELEYYRDGGIPTFVARQIIKAASGGNAARPMQ